MKKLLLMALAGVAFASCSNHDDWFDAEKYAAEKHEAKVQEYTQAFIREFGTPAPGHTWGFGTGTRTRAIATRGGENNNRNQWYSQGIIAPPDIDLKKDANNQNEEDRVLEAFQKHGKSESNINIVFTDFFVQQVHKGTNQGQQSYVKTTQNGVETGTSNFGECSNNMDYIMCGKSTMSDDELKQDANHVPNFNNGKSDGCNVSVDKDDNNQDVCVNYNRGISYMTNSSTQTFAYWNSQSKTVERRYIILEVGGSYYVGFNFHSEKTDGDTKYTYSRTDKADDYTDWIVKITPGDWYKKDKELFQIWCEDLGGSYGKNGNDFDFNDVVLSFKETSDKDIEIWLEAAGGTMPINVYWDDVLLGEVHNAFEDGLSTSTMVNTQNGTAQMDHVKLLDGLSGISAENVASYLKIEIKDGETGEWYPLSNEDSTAPQMILCEPGLDWAKERQNINEAYPVSFKAWVGMQKAGSFKGNEK